MAQGGGTVGMAMVLALARSQRGPAHGFAAAASSGSGHVGQGAAGGNRQGGHCQTGDEPHVSTQFRDPPVAAGQRYPDNPGTAGLRGSEHTMIYTHVHRMGDQENSLAGPNRDFKRPDERIPTRQFSPGPEPFLPGGLGSRRRHCQFPLFFACFLRPGNFHRPWHIRC